MISLAANAAMAQPVIDKLFDYSPGNTYTYRKLQSGSLIDTGTIPTVGANLTWNLSALHFDATIYTDSIIDYASSIYNTSFPGCTYVFKEYIGLEQYYRKSGDTILYMGNSYSPNQYSPNPPVVKFPGTFSLAPNNVYGPVTTNVVGSGTWTYYGRYNAYGTLQLGGSTLTNVALYLTHGGMSTVSFTDYMWVRQGEKDPLFRIQFIHQGGTTTVNLGYATPFALGVDQAAAEIKASISPNPCSDVLTITAADEISSVMVYDVSGRVMMNEVVNSSNTKLDIRGLAAGLYFVKLTAKSGAVQTNKIVKQQ